MYVKLLNNQPNKFPYTSADLRRENPGTSFPDEITDEMYASYGVVPVVESEVPAYDSKTHRVTQSVRLIGSDWTQFWTVHELPESQASANVRAERNHLLASSDYTQLPDAPVDSVAWATYRQQLRDITAQEGFPFTVTWPAEP
jgi:hypothetical protein